MLTLEKEIKKFHHNLDFSQLLEEKGLRWVRGGGKTCNKILNDIFKKQKHWKDGKNEWTEISQLGGFSIKKGSDIRRYTGILQEKEIIEISRYKLYGSYGTKCYSYKFDDDFYKNELQSIRNKKSILQKRTSSKPKESNNKIEDGELHKIIKKNSEKLIIDFERLEREVDQGNGELMSEISDTFGKFVKEEGHHIYDDVNGRMYSPWIETTREYRKFITHKEGKTLVDLDITSSHPTILSSLYPKFDYVKSKADKKAAKEA